MSESLFANYKVLDCSALPLELIADRVDDFWWEHRWTVWHPDLWFDGRWSG